MTVETNANFLTELNETFPRKGDLIKEGDDHMRLIKHCLKVTLPGFSSAVKMSSDTLNLFNSNFTVKADRTDINTSVYAVANKIWDLAANRIRNVADPVDNQDVVTKAYMTKNSAATSWPVGAIYLTMSTDNPNKTFGFGTWAPIAAGRCLVGAGTGVDDRNEARPFGLGEARGEYQHGLTTEEMPNHGHGHNLSGFAQQAGNHRHALRMHDYRMSIHDRHCRVFGDRYSEVVEYTEYEGNHTHTVTISGAIAGNGGNKAHNNVQPYFVVNMWRRTA